MDDSKNHNLAQEVVDLRDIAVRLGRGLPQTIGLALMGLVVAAIVCIEINNRSSILTSTRVTLSFPNLGKGEYFDRVQFLSDDLRGPDVIGEALKRQGIADDQRMESTISNALSIDGTIPATVITERARLQAAGQTPPPYIPNEYAISLNLPHTFPLSIQQRQSLLSEILHVYQEKFWRNYGDLPQSLGNVFFILKNADFPDYELILRQNIQDIISFLNQRINDTDGVGSTFRSPTTGLTFNDLLGQVQIFSQVELNGTLGLIYLDGLSHDRATAITKLDYQLQLLEEQKNRAMQDQTVVQDLLSKTQERYSSYTPSVKSAEVNPSARQSDQELIGSLSNDAYTFLVHEALKAGLKVKDIESDEAAMAARRKRIEAPSENQAEQATLSAQVQKSLDELESSYNNLISDIRKTNIDFVHQKFADSVQLSLPVTSEERARPLLVIVVIGALLGLASGIGLSLIGIHIGSNRKS